MVSIKDGVKVLRERTREATAQEIMPLKTLVGPVMRRRDGGKVIAIELIGRNDSLDTAEQKREWGMSLAKCLRGSTQPMSLVKVPRTVAADGDLARIDRELAGLEREIAECTGKRVRPRKRELERRRQLLVERLRPDCEREALAGDKIDQRTYLLMEFGAEVTEARAVEVAGTMVNTLLAEKTPARVLQAGEAVELMQCYFTPRDVDAARAKGPRALMTGAGKPPRRLGRKGPDVGEAMLLSAVTPDICESEHYIEVDDRFVRTVAFDKYRWSGVDAGWLDWLFKHTEMAIAMRLDPLDESLLEHMVDNNEGNIESIVLGRRRLKASERNTLARDQEHGERILDMSGDDSEQFFDVTLYAVVEAESAEALEKRTAQLRKEAKGVGMDFLHIRAGQLASWMAASPLMAPDPDARRRVAVPMPAATVGYTNFPKRPGLDDMSGITLGRDPNDGIVRLDMVTTSDVRLNRNVAMLGKSGGGKTTMAEHIALDERLMYGSRLIIIDPDRQFTTFARSLNGQVIDMSTASAAKLSPLQPRAVTFTEGDDDKEESAGEELVLAATIPFVKSFVKRAFALRREDMAPLEEALELAYGRYGIDKETTFDEYLHDNMSYPVMKDLYDALRELAEDGWDRPERYDRIADELRSAAVGIYAKMWNERTTVDISKSEVVCIDTSGMGANEDMQVAQYYNVLSWVWSECRLNAGSGRPIRIIADEGQNMLTPKMVEAADMVRSIAKRIRKLQGGLTFICQDMFDMFDDSVRTQGMAVFDNATYRLIGHADGENLKQIAAIMEIEPSLQERISTARRGQFAVYAGAAGRSWVTYEAEDWELELFGKQREAAA